ncbi:alpha-galactosidase [Nonomuraea sp. NPDC050328]|uniref:alpha-galactosidase n=1 Tax=Nonomuraea sp. NPDC050328 TaxID=3364361 RepID=UPI0037B5DFE0
MIVSAGRLWLLTTASSGYVVRLDADDTPRCAHWGPPLTLDQARDLPPGAEELPVEGGERFGVPALQLRYADGVRGAEWRFLGEELDGERLVLRLADRHYPLEIGLHYRLRGEVLERHTTLVNHGDTPITLLRCDSAAWSPPGREAWRLTHVSGEWGGEFRLRRTPLPVAETVLTSRRGHSGHEVNPWLMLDAGEATEAHGEVWSTALAWSGSWRMTVRREHGGGLTWSGGHGHDGLTWRLEPGGRAETPVFAGVYSPDGFGGASHRWHDYLRDDRLRPVVYNSWEATGFAISPGQQLALAERAAALGAEVFVVDDGWFAGRSSDRAGLGDWHADPGRFPDGLEPLADAVRALGMGFGLWVEPESVNPDSELARTRPEWILGQPHRRATQVRNQLLLDFSRDEVAEWALGRLDHLVGRYGVAFLKWDMNRPVTEAGDDVWIPYIRNVYAVLDRLRAAHPGLLVEGCASGGGRADPGMLARTDQIWTSDNTDAAQRLAIQHGYGHLYPAATMGAWVTDSPNAQTARITPLAFRFHVAMAGALGLGGDLLRWSEQELAEAAGLVARYKEIRPVVHRGRLDRLGEHAVQYSHEDRVVVLICRPSTLLPATAPVRPRGLDPGAAYRDEDTGAVHHGAVLLSHGLPQPLPFDATSTLTRLRRLR